MSIQPQGEALRNAVRFISEQLQATPGTGVGPLIQTACMKFDLSPKESEYLLQFYRDPENADLEI